MDLLDVWRGRISARAVLNLIDRLPRDSHYVAAMADDDELADEMPDDDGPAPPPPLTDFGPEVEKLTLIADRLGTLIAAVAKSAGAKAKDPPPLPRPVTARERAKQRRRVAKHTLVLDKLAEAAAAGQPTMADVQADATSVR